MEILKYILLGIEAILSIVLIVLMMMQSSKGNGASGAISGNTNSDDSYFGKNMDRSKEANLARATMFSGIAFMVVTFVLGLLYII